MSRSILLTTLLLSLGAKPALEPADDGRTASPASYSAKGMLIERGEGRVPLFVPGAEVLEYDVGVDIAVVGEADVGSFVLRSGTEPYRKGLPEPGTVQAADKQVAWIQAIATGGALGYRIEQTIEARLLPQVWPRVVLRNVQRGSESRRYQLMYGERGGAPTAWFREDRHCQSCERREHFVEGLFSSEHHCPKCKRAEHRVWKEPQTREIAPDAVDMMSATLIARSMVRSGLEETQFSMLDRHRTWQVTLTRASRRKIETPAGAFWCREVKMSPRIPKDQDQTKFEGLFGIHGTLSFWLEEKSGVPIMIEGIVPLGPFDLGASLKLEKYSGTPPDFAPAAD